MLSDLLLRNKEDIQERWVRALIATYPADTARFLRQERDQFLNPVGFTIKQESAAILDGLARGAAVEDLREPLDNIIRLRAVQDFAPAQAVGFVLHLKTAVRESLAAQKQESASQEELLALDNWVDGLVLVAFDVYSRRRERIFEIRTKEIRGHADRVMNRLNRLYGEAQPSDSETDEPGGGSSNNQRGSGQ
ncbi:MAG: RsbRD N-terminal domain-containing protein [Chloroflexota bacterium]